MAGIAFKLRSYTEDESYLGILKGYTYSTLLVAGPWLISAGTLGTLAIFAQGEMGLLHATIMYIFCFSLVYVGLFQFIVTRFLADKLYSGEIDLHIPTFMGTLLLTLAPQALAGGLFLMTVEAPFHYRLFSFGTYMVINTLWVILLFLGILRAYQWAVGSFVIGGCVSLITGYALAGYSTQTGTMVAFLAGQTVTLAILIWLLISEFPWQKKIDFSFLAYFRLYPSLSVLGVLYYLSIWIDKFLYRASPLGQLMAPKYLYAAPSYELSAFVAQLTIIPALAIFFLRVETDFYERYREFFAAITQHHPLALIEKYQKALLNSAWEGLRILLVFQGTVSLVAILLAPQIFRLLAMDETQLMILRVLLLGTFFQTLLFLVIILMLYFEFFRPALLSCGLFFCANALLTQVFLHFLPQAVGWGFTLAALIAFLYGTFAFRTSLMRLPEITFMRQLSPPVIATDRTLYQPGGIALYHLRPKGRT